MDGRTVFTGSVIRAAVEALRKVGVAPALLETAGPSDDARIDEALVRATGLEADVLHYLREALVAVGDHAAEVKRVQRLSPLDDARGAISVCASLYRIERHGDTSTPSRKRRKAPKEKSPPALVTIVRAGERERAARAESAVPDALAPTASPSAVPPSEGPAQRQLPAGRGRFTSAGRLEAGGSPGTAAWSRPLAEPPRAAPAAPIGRRPPLERSPRAGVRPGSPDGRSRKGSERAGKHPPRRS